MSASYYNFQSNSGVVYSLSIGVFRKADVSSIAVYDINFDSFPQDKAKIYEPYKWMVAILSTRILTDKALFIFCPSEEPIKKSEHNQDLSNAIFRSTLFNLLISRFDCDKIVSKTYSYQGQIMTILHHSRYSKEASDYAAPFDS